MRIGVIGTGTIAGAVVRGIAGDGHDIRVSRRSAAVSSALAAEFDNVAVAENQVVVDGSDVILVALMAEVAPDVLSPLSFWADQRVISVMAGPGPDQVTAWVAPARVEAVVIPFPAIATGGSPVLSCPATDLVRELFGARNHVFGLRSAADLPAYLAAQGVLSPALKMLDIVAEWLAARTGDRDTAESFLRVLVGGSLLADPLGQPGVLPGLLAALNTPGGFNAELRENMMARGMGAALLDGLDRLEKRQ